MSGVVSGPQTVFDHKHHKHHKHIHRRFVLGSTTLQTSCSNPTWLWSTLSTPYSLRSCEIQNVIFQGFHNHGTSPKTSLELPTKAWYSSAIPPKSSLHWTLFTRMYPPGTQYTAESTEAIRKKCLTQGQNTLMPGFKPSASVSETDILTTWPICS